MKTLLLFLTYMISVQMAFTQVDKEVSRALADLYFMQGVWKGTGWIQTGGKKQPFRETETVTLKLSGSAMQIEAYGTALGDSSTIINDALGIVSYNQANKNYTLRIFQSDGSFVEADARILKPFTFEWKLKISAGYIKYVITVEAGNWKEYGYRSTDNKNWTQTFEMELTKQ
jgi:hypothetical protein